MLRRSGLCLLLLLISFFAHGITALPAYTLFYMPAQGKVPAQPYVEMYWQVDPSSVHFTKNEKELWIGRIKTELLITSDTGVVVSEKFYLQTIQAASLRAAQFQNIMDLHRYIVPRGKINISLKLSQDGYEQELYEYKDSLEVADTGKVFYSNVQLLDTSYQTDMTDNPFVKNNRLQIPLCFNFLDEKKQMLHYYTELYGLDKAKKGRYTQVVTVSRKPYDFAIYNLVTTDTLAPANILPISGRFNINMLPSGNYHLNILLMDSNHVDVAKQTVFFQQSNTHPVVPQDTSTGDSTKPLFEKVNMFDLSTTFVAKYEPAQLKAIMKMLLPIATETERGNIESFIKSPDVTYMRYFIYNFWKSRATGDPEDEWKKYTQKVKDVNKLFGSRSRGGYETERGFYYLKYGPPDQRYTVSNEEGAWPYEIWQYNAPGNQSYNGEFLFYNPGFMVSDYRLLHSTVKGEMRNTAWRNQLYKTGASSGNLNSRAEQILQNR